jgi:hypothetical protein
MREFLPKTMVSSGRASKEVTRLVYKSAAELSNSYLDVLENSVAINVFKSSVYSTYLQPGALSNLVGGCQFRGVRLYGKVAFTYDLSKANFKVYYNRLPGNSDIAVSFVANNPDSCGKWQIVESWDSPNFTVAMVSNRENADLTFYTGY